MSRRFGILCLLLALAAGCALYALKDKVRRLEAELHQVQAAIVAERIALSRLRTEWAILTRPGRLERLAHRHLGLVPAHPGQIVALGELPFRADLELSGRRWEAVLPSGAEVTLRLKPFRAAAALEGLPATLEARATETTP